MARHYITLLAVAVLVPFHAALAASVSADEQDLIGWLGERPRNSDGEASGAAQTREHGMVVLSWEPRIFLFRSILSQEECDEVIAQATPRLERSGVSDSTTGESKLSDIRTSSGMFYSRGENKLIKSIEQRLAKWTMIPEENGEGIQVLHYEKTQEYRPHEYADYNGGNRLATVLMYLADVEEGGETVFPKVPVPPNQTKAAGFSDCAMKGMAYKPRKGDAIAFWSIKPDGRFDVKSLHGSCPVIKGEKWSATKWIHIASLGSGKVVRVQHVPPPPPDVPGCVNRHKLCNHWMEAGECEDNPVYMIGSAAAPGDCIKACNRCDLGPNEKPKT